ncbi:MAG TPA: DUF58 domain-containing protein [Polyangiaceae bacterium LLY-WYZ-14_1]|nr:DUF58 domain-containing protein [Polyangiaceae bacterium LLY-WYZ-14_1]
MREAFRRVFPSGLLSSAGGSTARGRGAAGGDQDGDELFDESFQRRLEVLAMVARKVHAGRQRAERRTRKIGSGIEFADHREYAPGDDFRSLDWNVYQRLGRLLVRLYEEEEDLTVYVLLDASRSMAHGRPSKLRYGKRVAAALAYVALSNLDRVSVQTFSDRMDGRLPPTRGKSRIFNVFDFLRGVTPGGATSTADAFKTFVAQHDRRGLVLLLSDLYDAAGFEAGINALRYARFEPHVLHLVDAREAELPLRGDLRLVDAETGAGREVTVTDGLLDRYREAHRTWQQRVADFCVQKQVPRYALDVSVPFDDAVLAVLRQGGILR